MTQTTPLPFPASEGTTTVFKPGKQELEVEFGEQFSKLLGKFVYCADIEELEAQLSTLIAHNKWEKIFFREDEMKTVFSSSLFGKTSYPDLATANAAITTCEALVARTGSIIMSSAQKKRTHNKRLR